MLNLIKGNIYWVTDGYNIPVFSDDLPQLHLIDSSNLPEYIFNIHFDLIINLEEDIHLAGITGKLHYARLVGVYLKDGQLGYTPESAPWYDMSLISVHGTIRADQLKKQNVLSYQEILFNMLGVSFKGEPYCIYRAEKINKPHRKPIGIEMLSGTQWPNKQWHGYTALKQLLEAEGYEVIQFQKRNDLRAYLSDIQQCAVVVCGDTLSLHIALAYQIPVAGIFNCTSPYEIYAYGVLEKIISPMLLENYYSRVEDQRVMESIPVKTVFDAVMKIAGRSGE